MGWGFSCFCRESAGDSGAPSDPKPHCTTSIRLAHPCARVRGLPASPPETRPMLAAPHPDPPPLKEGGDSKGAVLCDPTAFAPPTMRLQAGGLSIARDRYGFDAMRS